MPEIATKADLLATEQRLQTEFRTRITTLETKLDTRFETQTLQPTVRLGAMVVVAIGALATIVTILKLS